MKDNLKEFISKFSLQHDLSNVEEVAMPQVEERYNEPVVSARKKTPAMCSVIADNVIIKGSISTSSDIEIAGIVEGDITAEGGVSISGTVTGNITGLNIELRNCETRGNIISSHSVSQNKDSITTGDISAVTLNLAGKIYGNISATEGITLQNTASIVGDIEAKSISVFEGAIMNGKIQIAAK